MINKRGFFSFLGMLLALMVIGALCYVIFNGYSNFTTAPLPQKDSVTGQGVSFSHPQSVINYTRSQLGIVEQKMLDRQQQWDSVE